MPRSRCLPLAGLLLVWLAQSPAQATTAWPAADAHARHQLQAWQQQYRQLPAVEQQRIARAAEQFRRLPPVEQQQLQRSFAQLDQHHRDGWRLGPRLGRHWAGLQPLFAYVLPEQREPLLQMLHGLDDPSLERLVRLAQRTPPEQRQELRAQLLQQPASRRGTWLQQAGP